MSRVSKKEAIFFDIFKDLSTHALKVAELYARVPAEWPSSKELLSEITALEEDADDIAYRAYGELNRSFITPFDREDVGLLIDQIDEVIDSMEGVAARFALYDVNKMVPEAQQMAQITLKAIKDMDKLFEHFEDFKKDEAVREHLRAILAAENEGDVVYRTGLGGLFSEGEDPIHIFKWKSLLDGMEDALDNCKRVANTVRGVLIKNA